MPTTLIIVLTMPPPVLLVLELALVVLVINVVGVTGTTTVVTEREEVGKVTGTIDVEVRAVAVDVGVVTVAPPLAPGPLIKARDAETQSRSVQP